MTTAPEWEAALPAAQWEAPRPVRRVDRASRRMVEREAQLEALRGPAGVDQDDNWRGRALCAEVDPELFFPVKGGSVREALRICARCPVREPCGDFADSLGYAHGVWGGETENRRRRDA